MRPGCYPWTEELRDTALTLWKEGRSGGQIAKALPGKITPNAVVAKINAMGKIAARSNGGVNPYLRPSPIIAPQWPAATLKQAVKMWEEGLSSSQIAQKLGASRNAVIGQIDRAGKRAAKKNDGVNPYLRPMSRRNISKPGPRFAKPAAIPREIDFDGITPGDRLPPLVKLDSRLWLPLPGTTPKPLLDLSSRDCRWPIDGDEFLFCAATTNEGCSYCATHSRWSVSKATLRPLNFNKRAA